MARNSDGSYDAVDSGGFGKDYHGQDVFGERIGGTGIGGSHFGGFAAGHVGLDEDNTQEYEKLSYGDITQTEDTPKSAFEADDSNESSEEEAGSDMKDTLRDLNSESSEDDDKVGSLDTSMLIGENEDEKAKSSFTDKMEPDKAEEEKAKAIEEDKELIEKYKKEISRLDEVIKKSELENNKRLEDIDTEANYLNELISTMAKSGTTAFLDGADNAGPGSKLSKAAAEKAQQQSRDSFVDAYYDFAKKHNYSKLSTINKEQLKNGYFDGTENLPTFFKGLVNDVVEEAKVNSNFEYMKTASYKYQLEGKIEELEDSIAERTKEEKLKSSFTDKMEESKEEAKPGPNMSKASVGESDYLTKANKDSTKKVAPSRNDYLNHVVDTAKGFVDIIADNSTAKALGIQSLEDFAKEKGVDPNKLSTMIAYKSYQTKQIWKSVPTIIKKAGGYLDERIKDFFDTNQAPERIRNTVARYNAATLVGATILSIQSGAGIQASIDRALTIVDPEDQPAVAEFLEDVLNDEGMVADLSNAFDDALAPEQTSDTDDLDESIVNIGRKDNTDYSDFNAGLGTSGTTSDADVKVFITRNIHSDPILRRMISKMGK